MSEITRGYTDGQEFRIANGYTDTQRLFETLGLSDLVENRTPTVGVNVAHLAGMRSVQALGGEFGGKKVGATILGISTVQGPRDFEKLLHGLGVSHVSTIAVDISDGIFVEIEQLGLDEVKCMQRDARETEITLGSQDIVLRDHIGNCCPPKIDREIDREASHILRDGGIAVVNITTSDLLSKSEGRLIIPFKQLQHELGDEVVHSLQTGIYDLEEAIRLFPQSSIESLRSAIVEIEPESFVVFGEDKQGHGEWFRTLDDHRKTWTQDGFEVVEVATRAGKDSHEPPLECLRHNVVLRKKITNLEKAK
ncbi:hypothetical protein COS52_03810 [Candidatus Roizmanbacteria bacterium CG03_land_8_20_14_0_80_39_12]|uniref:Uncharacterized protein n=2 Tax=Candidatus Roizmaniibacteriota TaxID=1752723 RepID=A0A2M7BRV5_9BACT|nr:MAG: hypothetical protein COS52_03810 [Candidatus Roizmanbacteria bacterium CG03_land_8_20_14_0_80_39_12]